MTHERWVVTFSQERGGHEGAHVHLHPGVGLGLGGGGGGGGAQRGHRHQKHHPGGLQSTV